MARHAPPLAPRPTPARLAPLATLRRAVALVVPLVLAGGLLAACDEGREDEFDREAQRIVNRQGDPGLGRFTFTDVAEPSCGECHSMADAGARSDVATDLDEAQPSKHAVVRSLLSDDVAAHVGVDYREQLTDQQIGDIAAYVSEEAGGG